MLLWRKRLHTRQVTHRLAVSLCVVGLLLGAGPVGVTATTRVEQPVATDSLSTRAQMPRPAAGTILSTMIMGDYLLALAVDERSSRVFVADASDATVRMLDAQTGKLLHTVHIGPTPSSIGYSNGSNPQAMVADARTNRVFVIALLCSGCEPHTVSMLDATTGALLRTVTVGAFPSAMTVDAQTNHVFVSTQGSGLAHSGRVSMLDARSGTLLRTVFAGDDPVALAVDAPTHRVFVVDASYDGFVTTLDATNGAIVRTVAAGVYPKAVVVDTRTRRVFVGGNTSEDGGNVVYVLDAATGALLHTVPFPGVTQSYGVMAIDEQGGHVWTVNFNGSVSMLNATTGAVVHTTGLGTAPWAVAMDAHTGRAFVLTGVEPTGNGDEPATSVTILNLQTGAVLRTVDVGAHYPGTLAIDQQIGHVFVTTMEATVAGKLISGTVTMLSAGP